MVWSAPMTAASNSLLTAAQFNVHVRDNLLETEASRAMVAGKPWFSDGPNRSSEHDYKFGAVETLETTSSEEYVDLATVGPRCEVVANGLLLIFTNAAMEINTANDANASYEIYESFNLLPLEDGGGFLSPANNSRAITHDGATGTGLEARMGCVQIFGDPAMPLKTKHTVKMLYRVTASAAVGTFQRRRLMVMAL